MANIKSSKKRIKVAERNRMRNMAQRSALRTYIKRYETALAAGDLAKAEQELQLAVRKLDKAVTKGLIHKNKAARHKSRLMKKWNQAKAANA
ncbi:MAG: 30S ribosomal protein S20 [Bacillus thermozeamaize]|jgi:small subunit ribosomal protein S20|uniref:Small ribosomal subunit protein bS20 n=1 Tax=Bacillus thermozeamaize TaxID=230954 RepID=A0A1Y3PT83_9BACI|nr:MAG: 30S ribosomal protein S20 [Bacillus thermozeamaize]